MRLRGMHTERERAARRIGGAVIRAGAGSRGNHLAALEPQRIRAVRSLEGNQPVRRSGRSRRSGFEARQYPRPKVRRWKIFESTFDAASVYGGKPWPGGRPAGKAGAGLAGCQAPIPDEALRLARSRLLGDARRDR
jgi:hypothetical protein